MASKKIVDLAGLTEFWSKAKTYMASKFLPLSGGTLTGNIAIATGASTSPAVHVKRTDTGRDLMLLVGAADGKTGGLWSSDANKYLISINASDVVTVNGRATQDGNGNVITETYIPVSKFNLATTKTVNASSLATGLEGSINLAYNSDGSIYKLYGYMVNNTSAEIKLTLKNIPGFASTVYGLATGLYLPSGGGYRVSSGGMAHGSTYSYQAQFAVGTDHQIYVAYFGTSSFGLSAKGGGLWYPACIYFNSNFGD